ncbi:MAG: PHP domain-containing protein [Endomicrobia bacterium]|nr:PHP domain-containing protein [Endomicrobiia bacterium]
MRLSIVERVFLILVFLSFCFSEDLKKISCVLHIHSNFSDGKYTIEEIAEIAKQNNIDCIIFTDHFIQKVEFGLWPLRKLIKKVVENTSIMSIGIENYLNTIHNLSRQQKDVILIPGAEVTPHYFWTVEDETLVAKNLHKHMLILNLNDKNIVKLLPVVHNQIKFPLVKILLCVVGTILLVLAIVLKWRLFSLVCIIIVVVSLPFKESIFNQYKNYYEKPYQYLIDYLKQKSKDIIILWAHPEAVNYQEKIVLKTIKKLKITTQTSPYYSSLLRTTGYDGFSIFAEGYRKIGSISGIWDAVLKEYLSGKRENPIWCYAEVDFGETEDQLFVRKNILYVKEKSYYEVIKSLKHGHFYTLWRDKEKELVLEKATINTQELIFGKTYKIDTEKIKIELFLTTSDASNMNTKIYIIQNGDTVFVESKKIPAKITFVGAKPSKKSYYRIFIESDYPHMIATNPVFVE